MRATKLLRAYCSTLFLYRLTSVVTTIAYLAVLAGPAHGGVPTLAANEVSSRFNFTDTSLSAPAAEEARAKQKQTERRDVPVDNLGAYRTRISIQAPPGRLGMQPSLSLSYGSDSVRKETAVGTGWSFGTASISRSTKDGFPKLTASQVYDNSGEFEGPNGLLTPSTDLPTGATGVGYANLRDTNNARFVFDSANDSWTEYRSDGARRFYGSLAGKGVRIRNEHGTFSWVLREERDPHGNTVTYEYHYAGDEYRSSLYHAQRLPVVAKVRWGGNPSVGLTGVASISWTAVTMQPLGVIATSIQTQLDFHS